MAVNFGDTAFEGALPPSVPIVEPVADRSSETFATGIASALDQFSTFWSANKATDDAAANNALFGEITERVNFYADAREQGISSSEIYSRLRADQNAWMANNPGQEIFIQEAISKIMGDNGLVNNIETKTPEEKAQDAVLQKAAEFGWSFDPNMSIEDAVSVFTANERQKQQVQDIANEIAILEGDGKKLTAAIQSQATIALHGLMKTSLPWVTGKIDEGFKRLEGVTDPAARAVIISDIEQQITAQTSIIKDVSSQTGSDKSYLTKPAEDLLASFKKVANNEETIEQYKKQKELGQAKIDALIGMDTELATWLTLSKLTPNDPAVMAGVQAGAYRVLRGLGIGGGLVPEGEEGDVPQKVTDIVDGSKDTADALNILQTKVAEVNASPDVDQPTMDELNATISNTLKSVSKYAQAGTDPRELSSFMKFMADPAVGKYIEEHPDIFSPEDSKNAAYVVDQYYNTVGIDLVNERWAEAQTLLVKSVDKLTTEQMIALSGGTGSLGAENTEIENINLTDAIEPIWNGAGIEFVPKDQFRNNVIIRNLTKGLNEDISGPLNNMVRASTHMTGSRDYEAVYNENYANRLWVADDKPTTSLDDAMGKMGAPSVETANTAFLQQDKPSDLTLDDYDVDAATKIVENSGAADPAAMVSATKPLEIAEAYLGYNENNTGQAATLAAFIKKSSGTEINPAQTAWCAAFMNAVLGASGGVGTGKLNAKSFLTWGVDAGDHPSVGDVVVLQREGGEAWQGHVGFYMGTNPDGTIKVLAGNQGDQVSEKDWDSSLVLGFRKAA